MSVKYYPTTHAIDRAILRFGINAENAGEWIRRKLKEAKYVSESNGGATLLFENDGIRFVVDGKKNTVITLHAATRLDFLRPTLEREIRKIKRESTRQIRMMERNLASMYAELSERMRNCANARNPQTRELIESRVTELQTEIETFSSDIERVKDDVQAKIKAIELIAE